MKYGKTKYIDGGLGPVFPKPANDPFGIGDMAFFSKEAQPCPPGMTYSNELRKCVPISKGSVYQAKNTMYAPPEQRSPTGLPAQNPGLWDDPSTFRPVPVNPDRVNLPDISAQTGYVASTDGGALNHDKQPPAVSPYYPSYRTPGNTMATILGAANVIGLDLAERKARSRQDQYYQNNIANPYGGILPYANGLSDDTRYGSVGFEEGGQVMQEGGQAMYEFLFEDDEDEPQVQHTPDHSYDSLYEMGMPKRSDYKDENSFSDDLEEWKTKYLSEDTTPNEDEGKQRARDMFNSLIQRRNVINTLDSSIADRESGGNYQAFNPAGGGEGAVGKYQFRYTTHKREIAKVTGIESKKDFLNNPEAQEAYFDYWKNTTLLPTANYLLPLAQRRNPDATVDEIARIVHFLGPDEAKKYYRTGKSNVKDANGTTAETYQKGGLYIGPSDIHGDGLYTASKIAKDTTLPYAAHHLTDEGAQHTEFGGSINHSSKPNTKLVVDGDKTYIHVSKTIKPDEEFTLDYSKTYNTDGSFNPYVNSMLEGDPTKQSYRKGGRVGSFEEMTGIKPIKSVNTPIDDTKVVKPIITETKKQKLLRNREEDNVKSTKFLNEYYDWATDNQSFYKDLSSSDSAEARLDYRNLRKLDYNRLTSEITNLGNIANPNYELIGRKYDTLFSKGADPEFIDNPSLKKQTEDDLAAAYRAKRKLPLSALNAKDSAINYYPGFVKDKQGLLGEYLGQDKILNVSDIERLGTLIHEKAHKADVSKRMKGYAETHDLVSKLINKSISVNHNIDPTQGIDLEYLTDFSERQARHRTTNFWLSENMPGYDYKKPITQTEYDFLLKNKAKLPMDVKQIMALYGDPNSFIDNINKFQRGGRVPIYTDNKNDPKLKSYTDSLNAYNYGVNYEKALDTFIGKNSTKGMGTASAKYEKSNTLPNNNLKPIEKTYYAGYADTDGAYPKSSIYKTNTPKSKDNIITDIPQYKKPVQPVVYQPQQKGNPPIYTSNPNDPRIKNYQDSLSIYKSNHLDPEDTARPLLPSDGDWSYKGIAPIGYKNPTSTNTSGYPVFKKPVQPYIYRADAALTKNNNPVNIQAPTIGEQGITQPNLPDVNVGQVPNLPYVVEGYGQTKRFTNAEEGEKYMQELNKQTGKTLYQPSQGNIQGYYDLEALKKQKDMKLKHGGEFQQGGQTSHSQKIMQEVAQMLQQGAAPEEVMQQLIQSGVPQNQAMQIIQAVMQQMQGPMPQQQMAQARMGKYYKSKNC